MNAGQRRSELRRRVQQDPASLAFAPLAEELRRDGANEEAVAVCHAGLVHHPTLLTARITLGRALVELDRLEEAAAMLTGVLHDAPGNLAAMRALAEVQQRGGRSAAGATPAESGAALEKKVEALFDFDALLAQLGGRPDDQSHVADAPPAPSAIEAVVLSDHDRDELALVERQLRDRELRLMLEAQARQFSEERRRVKTLHELERWVAVIAAERRSIRPQA